MKKRTRISILIILALLLGVGGSAVSPHMTKAEGGDLMLSPTGYTSLDWIKESGIRTFIKKPETVGYIDFLTVIDLSQNEVKLMSTSTPKIHAGSAVAPFQDGKTQNWHFPRSMVESLKDTHPEAKFIWNAPFFNITMPDTVLSLGLKSVDEDGEYITSGSRPGNDMAEDRRMLIIDNDIGEASIYDFDEVLFAHKGDQAVEGFHPLGSPSSRAVQASRVYLGVRNGGRELVVYCSKSASKEEASNALIAAGVARAHQIQVDGGGSATCGYNFPGHYFVEPGRALPHIMGAIPKLHKGKTTIHNLNVRLGPGIQHQAIRRLPIASVVTIYEEQNGWVRISDNEWVFGTYVHTIKAVPYEAKVTIRRLNVRAGIGTHVPITRRLLLGESIRVLEEKDGWGRISDTEWVSSLYIK